MKRILIIIVLSWFCKGYAQFTFSKEFTGPGSEFDQIYSVCTSGDGGFVMAGRNESFGSGATWLSKINSTGSIQWAEYYGNFSNDDIPFSIHRVNSGGYILAGESYDFLTANYNPYMVRIDDNGNIVWQKTVTGSANVYFWDVVETPDLGFIFCGAYKSSSPGSNYHNLLIKTDSSGNLLWQKSFGGSSAEFLYSICKSYDNGYLIIGNSYGSGSGGIVVEKVDSMGIQQWGRSFYLTGYTYRPGEFGGSIKTTPDNGFIIVGSRGTATTQFDALLIKMDSLGTPLWTKAYGGPNSESFSSVDLTPDGGFIMTGSGAFDATQGAGFVLKTSGTGIPQWYHKYGDSTVLYSALSCADGGYLFGGYMDYATGPTGRDVLVIKADAAGETSMCNQPFIITVDSIPAYSTGTGIYGSVLSSLTLSNMTLSPVAFTPAEVVNCATIFTGTESELEKNETVFLYPNPTEGSFEVNSNEIILEISVYNILGNRMHQSILVSNLMKIDLSGMASGIYFVHMKTKKGLSVQRIIKK